MSSLRLKGADTMPVAFPTATSVNLNPPDAEEARLLARGVMSAISPAGGPTPLQRTLVAATVEAMTGHPMDAEPAPIAAHEYAERLANREEQFRVRMVQQMLLGALVLRPLPPEVAARVQDFAAELGVDDTMLPIAQEFAAGTLGLAALDFDRNGYSAEWSEGTHDALHTSEPLAEAWQQSCHDPQLAGRWCELERLPEGTLGRRVADFYRARGFVYPGAPGSAPPLLAQHDWVHVLADYGTRVESEASRCSRSSPGPTTTRGPSACWPWSCRSSRPATCARGRGSSRPTPGSCLTPGSRPASSDAMRRGALVDGSVDFLVVDWFELAPLALPDAVARFGIVPKSEAARQAGSVGPWEPGGISEFQWRAGQQLARVEQRPYDAFGAAVS